MQSEVTSRHRSAALVGCFFAARNWFLFLFSEAERRRFGGFSLSGVEQVSGVSNGKLRLESLVTLNKGERGGKISKRDGSPYSRVVQVQDLLCNCDCGIYNSSRVVRFPQTFTERMYHDLHVSYIHPRASAFQRHRQQIFSLPLSRGLEEN